MRLSLALWLGSFTLAVGSAVQGVVVPLYFVGTNSQAPAQMALDVLMGDYPPGTSSTNYPPPIDPTKAESVVASAVRLYTTEDFSALVDLHDPAERSKVTPTGYATLQTAFSNVVDVTFNQFYWFGSEEFITYRINYNGGVGFFGTNAVWGQDLHYVNGRFYLSTVLDDVALLVNRRIYDAIHGYSAPLAPSYRYAFRYPPSGGLHPLRVLFNGTAMKLRIDTNTVASDELEAFMTNVVATYRSGDVDASLALWNTAERHHFTQARSVDSRLFRQNMSQFNVPNVYLIFKLDFGPTAVLYYQTTDVDGNPIGRDNGVHLMTLFRGTNGHYSLTEQNAGNRVVFDDNMRAFLSDPLFVDFILEQVPSQPPPARK